MGCFMGQSYDLLSSSNRPTRRLLFAMMCICCTLWSTTIWAADSDKVKLKEVYSQYKSLFHQGKYVSSLPYVEQALELSKAVSGAKSKTTVILSHDYGINLLRAGKAKEASDVLSDTVDLYKEVYGSQAPELIGLYVDLSDARRTADYKSKWYKLHELALSIAKKVHGKNSAEYGMLLVDLGHIELINQAQNGERKIRRGYKILKDLDIPHPDMCRVEFIMGKLELGHRRYMDARTHLESSLLAMNEERVGPDFEQTARAFLVEALENLGESELATEHLLVIGRKQAEAGISNLKPLFLKKPNFPENVIKQQTGTNIDVKKMNEGTVVLEFDVDEKGFTRNIRVKMLDGPKDFVEPAIEAVKQYRFAPRFVDGKPVMVRDVTRTFNFLIF